MSNGEMQRKNAPRFLPRLLNIPELFSSASSASMAGLVRTPTRVCTHYELAIFTRDGGTAIVDGKSWPAAKGGLRFHRPGQEVSTVLHYECYTVRFLLDSVGDEREDAVSGYFERIPSYMPARLPDSYYRLFRELVALRRTGTSGSELLISARMLELIYLLCRDAEAESGAPPVSAHAAETVERAAAYMSSHYKERLTLEDVSREVSHSPNYFHRVFKAATGRSPAEYLNSVRLERARELMLITDLPVADIAAECGFSSPAYFTSVFRRENSVTPSEYRKSGRGY